ncbi:Uncharacterized protein Fot_36337 [Forsythia ovata]|uniref:Uncharacterized protein n=1 Tax=Forsythia ovata TaxID=205694 RepID=A0ABD1SP51_9LAMI
MGNKGPSRQSQEKHTMCQFISTPRVDIQGLRERPTIASLPGVGGHDKGKASVGDVRMEEIDISPIVEELQRFNANEVATTRYARTHERKNYNTRSSRLVLPRSR